MRRCRISAKEISCVTLKNDITDCFFRLNEMCFHKNLSSNTYRGEKCLLYRSGKLLQIRNTSNEKNYNRKGDIELTTRRNNRKE